MIRLAVCGINHLGTNHAHRQRFQSHPFPPKAHQGNGNAKFHRHKLKADPALSQLAQPNLINSATKAVITDH